MHAQPSVPVNPLLSSSCSWSSLPGPHKYCREFGVLRLLSVTYRGVQQLVEDVLDVFCVVELIAAIRRPLLPVRCRVAQCCAQSKDQLHAKQCRAYGATSSRNTCKRDLQTT